MAKVRLLGMYSTEEALTDAQLNTYSQGNVRELFAAK